MVQESKIEVVRQTSDRLDRSQAVVIVDYKGLNVAELTQLRAELREAQSELKVVKNRLTRRALEDTQCDALDDMLGGGMRFFLRRRVYARVFFMRSDMRTQTGCVFVYLSWFCCGWFLRVKGVRRYVCLFL